MQKILKIFKAILLGWRESDIILGFLKVILAICWLPMCTIIFLRIFKSDITEEEVAAILSASFFVGILLSCYIARCIVAVRYQEEHKCNFRRAWHATEIKL